MQGVVASLQTINSFPVERAIVLRERSAGVYMCFLVFLPFFSLPKKIKRTYENLTQNSTPTFLSLGAYYVSSYFMAKTVKDFIVNAWPPVLFSGIDIITLSFIILDDKPNKSLLTFLS
jgi:hypothetical protein